MKSMLIRRANAKDLPYIMGIIDDARKILGKMGVPQWQDSYPSLTDMKSDLKLKQLYVGVINHQVVGMAALSFIEDENYNRVIGGQWAIPHPSLVIHRVAVSGLFYGQGIAKELLRFAQSLAQSKGIKSLKADTHEKNTPMNQLLVEMGYLYRGKIILQREQSDPNRLAYEKLIA